MAALGRNRLGAIGLAAAVTLAGCSATATREYPTLQPIDGLLAEADSAFSRPSGP